MDNLTIGFIGYRGHATRLIKAFGEIENCTITHFFHPEKDVDLTAINLANTTNVVATRNLKDLYECDGIVIATPNYSHFYYLNILKDHYKGYIFCEKPPVSTIEELEILNNFPEDVKKKIHFNFNKRFSYLDEVLQTFPEKHNLGDIVRVSVIAGHGLAFKEAYKTMWHAKKDLHTAGVLETLGIHYLDLFSFQHGAPKDIFYKTSHYSPYGDSIDTCHLSCTFDDKFCFNLTCSYAIPFSNNIQVNYTNGTIAFNAGQIKVFAPRDTFDDKGFFMEPPVIYEETRDKNELYFESWKNSCRFFFDCIRHEREVDLKYFDQSIVSNRVCLSVGEKDKDAVYSS